MLKISLLFKKVTLKFLGFRMQNCPSKILRIQNAKFSGYWFYMKQNKYGDFQFCISVLFNEVEKIFNVSRVSLRSVKFNKCFKKI